MKDPIANNSTASVFTSLSLILLSFFVYLTSQTSVTEARRAAVLQSLRNDFPSAHRTENTAPLAPPPSAVEQASEEIASIAGIEGSALENKKQLKVRVQTSSIFLRDTDEIQSSFLPSLQALAAIMSKHRLQVKLQMVAPDLKTNLWQRGTPWEFGIAQAAAIVRGLSDYGVSPERIRGQVFLATGDSTLPFSVPRLSEHGSVELLLEESPHV